MISRTSFGWTGVVVLLLAGCEELNDLLESANTQQEVCGASAYRGNLFIRETETSKSLNGTFTELVFDLSTQQVTADVVFRQLGHDTRIGEDGQAYSTDCEYTGSLVASVAGIEAGEIRYRGLAMVESSRDMEGCILGPQSIEVSLSADAACEVVEGIWLHDPEDSLDTGRGTLRSTERYARELSGEEDPGIGEEDPGEGGDDLPRNAQGCPLNTDLFFSGPLVAANGCTATLNTRNVIDESGHLTGEMWLTEPQGNCDLTEGVMDAQVSAEGLVRGTVTGIITAYAGVQILEGCDQMVDGWFRIQEWDDQDIASYSLTRVE